jgi:hypothetical protein
VVAIDELDERRLVTVAQASDQVVVAHGPGA